MPIRRYKPEQVVTGAEDRSRRPCIQSVRKNFITLGGRRPSIQMGTEVTPLLWTVYGFRIKPHLSASIHS